MKINPELLLPMQLAKPSKLMTLWSMLILLSLFTGHAYGAQIWMSAAEPVWRSEKGWPPNDYYDLFRPNASWRRAEGAVNVFELSRRAVLQTSDADLDRILATLKEAHINLSVQSAHMLEGRDCEGEHGSTEFTAMMMKLKQHGATVAYIRMDEPLWFNHAFVQGRPGSKPCIMSINDLAGKIGIRLKAARKIFPNVIIGDIEPMGVPADKVTEWPADIEQWTDAYQRAMGEKLAFLQADVVWRRASWQAMLTAAAPILSRHEVPLGIVYNGTPDDKSDADWVSDAERHYKTVEGQLHILPAQAIFQSWMEYPIALQPESDPSSLTGLIDSYLDWSARGHRP